jgi:hypothetical protein
LGDGERLVWVGRPTPRLRASMLAVVIGAAALGTVALCAGCMAVDPPGDATMRLIVFGLGAIVVLLPVSRRLAP